jgi:uncharacterized sulfatase
MPASRGRADSSAGRRLVHWSAIGLLILVLSGLAWSLGRVVFYRQEDDLARVEAKTRYLDRVGVVGPERPINVVLVLFDDLGYGDLGVYGARSIRTPNLDRLAAEGVMFRAAYAPSPYCSASRAGLLTGRHAVRMGMDHVLQAPGTWQDNLLRLGGRNRRLPAEEITLSEVLSAAGYATAVFGKWHLGDESPSLPNDRGFDRFWGLLFSNDQGEPVVFRDRKVVEEHPIDQSTLTRRYTQRAVDFIEAHTDDPFFLYLPHTFPHVPLHVAPERLGRSPGGLYGDVVEELDWSVGEIVGALDRLALSERTMVVVSSDNGPWFQGSRGPLRGRKFDVFEGGTRVPLLVRWRSVWPDGTMVDEPVSLLDVFPTVLASIGLETPGDRVIDGESLAGWLEGGEDPRHRSIFFHQLGVPRGVRSGQFKYHDRRAVRFGNPMNWLWSPNRLRGPWLFDLEVDPSESYDVTSRRPDVAARLAAELADWRAELESSPGGWLAEQP